MQLKAKAVLALLGSLMLSNVLMNCQSRQVIPTEEVSYRLIDSSLSANYRRSWYTISVSQVPDIAHIRRLICQVVRDQKPTDYGTEGILDVGIYHNLEVHWYTPPTPEAAERQREHRIAGYTWSKNLPDRRDRITLWMTTDEKRLAVPQFYEFDHERDCAAVGPVR